MELIQIFDRKTGTWSERQEPNAGYSESFVLDKTTDSGESFIWREFRTDEPPYEDDDWVLLLHVEEKTDSLTFGNYGITSNATQYIIKSIQKEFDERNDMWTISVTLEEPIERFKRIVGETLSFTNQTSKVYTAESGGDPVTYYKRPYNYYTALRRFLMTTPANCDTYSVSYTSIVLEPGMNVSGMTLLFSNPEAFPKDPYTITFQDGSQIAVTTVPQVSFRHMEGMEELFFVIIDSPTTVVPYELGAVGTITSISGLGYWEEWAESCKLRQTENIYTPSPSNVSWYNRIKVLDEGWLSKIPFADDTWNEMDLYRVLFEKYDPLGRTPVIYFDLNTATGLPKNLARDEYLLKFERQDGFDKDVIEFDSLTATDDEGIGLGYTITKDNSANITGLVCNAENLSSPTVVHYPAQGLFILPEVDSVVRDTTGKTEQGDDWILRLPYPIKKINKVFSKELDAIYQSTAPPANQYLLGVSTYDLSSNVYELQEYQALNPTLSEPDPTFAYLWYEQGGNLLHIRGYRYRIPLSTLQPVTTSYMYYVEYEPLPSARLLFGDGEKTQQINQTSSQVDADKFGRFAESYLKGINKADITIGKHYYEYADFENLIGSRVNRNGKKYMITQVAYRNVGVAGYDVFMQLNENHLRKNTAYQAPQEIRANTAIATSNLKNRLTAIKQVVKVGFSAIAANDSYQFLTDKKIALSALCPGQIDSKYYPQVALFKGKSKLATSSNFATNADFEVTRLATISKILGPNTVSFVVAFNDNAKMAVSKSVRNAGDGGNRYTYSRVEGQIPVLYTDPFGEVEKTDVVLSSFNAGVLADRSHDYVDGDTWNNAYDYYHAMANLPIVNSNILSVLENNLAATVEGMQYSKDMLEICNINTAIEIEGQNCIVCSKLLALSRLVSQTDSHSLKVWVVNGELDEFDEFANGAQYAISSITLGAQYLEINLTSAVTGATGNALVIATNNDEPLLIYNNIDNITAGSLADGCFNIYYK